MPSEPPISHISDTARWMAVYRAQETERPDALFRDPLARRLAGPRGEEIAAAMAPAANQAWSFAARTVVFDEYIRAEVEAGADLVINLAAGLDTRPYRMALPATLRWIEVDLPSLLDYKEESLRGEMPTCQVERVRLDLSDRPARQQLFAELGGAARRVLILCEGLLIYLAREEVVALAEDLASPPSFRRWILDLASPGLLQMLQRQWARRLHEAAPLRFGPEEGPEFFRPFGWHPMTVCSTLKSAARLKRLPLVLRLVALLPESKGRQGKRPWSGLCLLARD